MHFSDSVTAFQSVKELFDPTACRQQQNSQRLFKTENNNHPPSRRGQDRPAHVSPRTSSSFQSRNQSFINVFITLSSFCLICIKGPVCRSWCTSQSSGVFFFDNPSFQAWSCVLVSRTKAVQTDVRSLLRNYSQLQAVVYMWRPILHATKITCDSNILLSFTGLPLQRLGFVLKLCKISEWVITMASLV